MYPWSGHYRRRRAYFPVFSCYRGCPGRGDRNRRSRSDIAFGKKGVLAQQCDECDQSGFKSILIVSACLEVILASNGFEDIGAGLEDVHEACDGALGNFAQKSFELGIGFLDGVHVRTVGRQLSQLGSGRFDELLDRRALVAR